MDFVSKQIERVKDSPLLSAGLTSFCGLAGYLTIMSMGKNPQQKASIFMIHSRVGIQGTIIAMMSVASFYHIFKDLKEKREKAKDNA